MKQFGNVHRETECSRADGLLIRWLDAVQNRELMANVIYDTAGFLDSQGVDWRRKDGMPSSTLGVEGRD